MTHSAAHYLDADLAYLLGLIVARGTIYTARGDRQIIIQFPQSSLEARGRTLHFDQNTNISLGLLKIQRRLKELLSVDVEQDQKESSIDLIAKFRGNNLIWRNIMGLLDGATSFPYFKVPLILFNPSSPIEWKREFLKGFGDVAGNVRLSNRYVNHRNRVRLDVLNYPTNWSLPVQLCTLLQDHVGVPVQLITWGHPNMKRAFREHQLNIFAEHYRSIGFSFEHKRQILDELAKENAGLSSPPTDDFCPGSRLVRHRKSRDKDEANREKLDPNLVNKHFDAYWQICRAVGCTRRPVSSQVDLELDVEQEDDI